MKGRSIALILLFFLASALPGLKAAFDPSRAGLGGSETSISIAAPTAGSLWSEDWQHSVEKWWSRAVGFRGYAVRSDNQLSLWLFGELGSQNRKRVVVGSDHYLFERAYVTAYEQSTEPAPVGRIRALAERIKQTEEILRKAGKAFVLVVSPSKASVVADKLPPSVKLNGEPLQEYKSFTAELSAKGVTYFDARKWLVEHKNELGAPIFYRSGSHWSQDSCCRLYQQIEPILEKQLGRPLRQIRCDPVSTRPRPYGQDGDLLRLANIWNDSPYVEPYAYPQNPADPDSNRYAPRVIAVGSSFMWDPLTMLRRFHLVSSKSRLYYYFKTRAIDPNHKLGAIDPAAAGWRDEISASDAVIVEINERTLLAAGFGFFEAMTGSAQAAEQADQSEDDLAGE